MIISEQLVAIIFRLLNFGVLIGLCFYLFKKYIKGMLISKMADAVRFVKGLRQERDSLARQHRALSDTVKTEQDEYNQLQQAVKKWTVAVEQEQARRAFEKNDRKRILKEKTASRTQQMRAQQLMQRVMPQVLADTQQQLQQLFDEPMGKRFMQRIIKQMQRGKS